jgi:hypothetical protein
MWTEKEMPLIKGLESSSVLEAKRWLDFRLNELLDNRIPVRICAAGLRSKVDVCRFVIEEIEYPIVRGQPNDNHKDNWFGGLCCYTLSLDFWQQASETIRTMRLGAKNGKAGYGDCEDVSVLFTDLFLIKGWEAFECLGEVYEGDEFLGGHGWAIFRDDWGTWRLYEATLTSAPNYPSNYPAINPDETEWTINGITYSAQAKFNRDVYYESEEGAIFSYIAVQIKESKKKYKALQQAWQAPVKPISRAGVLGRLRKW